MMGTGTFDCDACREPIGGAPLLVFIPNEGTDSMTRWEFCSESCLSIQLSKREIDLRDALGKADREDGEEPCRGCPTHCRGDE